MTPKTEDTILEDMSLRELCAKLQWLVGIDQRYADLLQSTPDDDQHQAHIRGQIADTHREIIAADIDDERDGWTLLEHLQWTLDLVLAERKQSGLDIFPPKEFSELMDWCSHVTADFCKR
jgi:hypothetical protein